MKSKIKKLLEKEESLIVSFEKNYLMPAWVRKLDVRLIKKLNSHCKYHHINPNELNRYTKDDFKKIYGIGDKGIQTILDTRNDMSKESGGVYVC